MNGATVNETIAGGSNVDAASSIAPDMAPRFPRILVMVASRVAASLSVDAERVGGSDRAGSRPVSVIEAVASASGAAEPGPVPPTTTAAVVVVVVPIVVDVDLGSVVDVVSGGRVEVVVVAATVVVVVDFGTVVDVVVDFGTVVVVVDVDVVDVVDVVVVLVGGSVSDTIP
jgi:hypothetical protein